MAIARGFSRRAATVELKLSTTSTKAALLGNVCFGQGELHQAAALYQQVLADALVVSVNTVKTQLKDIYRKLRVTSRQEARAMAQHLRLL